MCACVCVCVCVFVCVCVCVYLVSVSDRTPALDQGNALILGESFLSLPE